MLRSFSSSSFHRAVARRGSIAIANSLSSNSFHASSKSLNSEAQDVSSTTGTQQQQTMIARHLHHNNPHLLGSLSVRHPSSPFVLGWGDVECEMEEPRFAGACMRGLAVDDGLPVGVVEEPLEALEEEETKEPLSALGRNTRKLKKANHGSRPNNRLGRRARKRRNGRCRLQ